MITITSTQTKYLIANASKLFQDDASSSGTDMSICRSEALFSSYKDIPGPGTSESLIQVTFPTNCGEYLVKT